MRRKWWGCVINLTPRVLKRWEKISLGGDSRVQFTTWRPFQISRLSMEVVIGEEKASLLSQNCFFFFLFTQVCFLSQRGHFLEPSLLAPKPLVGIFISKHLENQASNVGWDQAWGTISSSLRSNAESFQEQLGDKPRRIGLEAPCPCIPYWIPDWMGKQGSRQAIVLIDRQRRLSQRWLEASRGRNKGSGSGVARSRVPGTLQCPCNPTITGKA